MKKITLLLCRIFLSAFSFAQINSTGFQFDGIDDYVRIPTISAYNIGTGDLTIEMWIKMNTYQVYPSTLLLYSPGPIPLIDPATIGISLSGGNGVYVFLGGAYNTFIGISFNDHLCHHLAIVRSGTTLSLYKDGTLFQSQSSAGSVTVPNYLQIGNSFTLDSYCGFVQEFRFWNLARTQSQIQAAMNTAISGFTSGIIGLWRLDYISLNTTYDFSIYNNAGSVFGPTTLAGCSNCTLPADTIYAPGPTTACNSVQLVAQSGNTSYKWYKYNGGFPILVSTTSFTLSANVSETYFCVITNSCGPVTTNKIAVTILPGPPASIWAGGPTIFCSPGSVTLNASTISGLTYQWRVNNVDIPGATAASYVASSAGSYRCFLTNSCGTVTSNAIVVAVLTSPPTATITANGATTICSPGSVTLIANTGDGLSYQWRLNGVNISGATASWRTVSTSGNYDCIVTNACGSSTSNIITVTISGVCSSALQFNGSNSQATISDNASYNLGTGDFTIEAWIKASTSQSASAPTILSKRGTTSNGFIFFLYSGQPSLQMAGINYVSTSINLRDNICHHVAVSRAGSTVKFYVDGTLVSTRTASTSNINSTHALWIGRDEPNPSPFTGTIHEIRFWSVERNPSQILASRDTFLTGLEPSLIGNWRMNEGTGQVIQDYSPTNNSGVLGTTASAEGTDPVWSYGCITNPCPFPSAVITAGGSTTVCSPATVTLDANIGSGLTYQWRLNGGNIPGATASSYTAATTGNYDCIVSNTCGSTMSNTITVTINSSPAATITAAGPTIFCSPGSVTLNANTGSGLTYQWQLNSSVIIGATTSSFVATATGNYDCVVSNSCGIATSNVITITVNSAPTAVITAAGPTTFCDPGSVTLDANTGSGLSYQWRLNGSDISGETLSSYSATASGNFDCVVTNSCGSTPSNIITVQADVLPSAAVTAGGPTAFCAPGSVMLSVSTCTGCTYQWRESAVNISGANSSSYPATAAGNYDCVVTNTCGARTSNNIVVTEDVAPTASITAVGSTTFCSPGSVTLDANTGTGLSYQWRLNGGNISGATSASYPATATGNYDCIVTNACGSATSNTISVTVNSIPSATITAAGSTTFCSPGSVTLNANTGTGLSYQWRLNGGNISGETASSYVANASGSYDCVVSNTCGSATSNSIAVMVNSLPSASISASGATTFCSPGSVTLNANTGTGLSYQWRLNSGNISGATLSFYTATATGNYDCIVSNSCGSATSNTISVTVNPLPTASITASGATTFCSPGSVTLNANTGTGLSYQWRQNGANISGATASSYTANATGSYDCVVTNSCGSATSNAISVTVNSLPATPGSITGQTTGVCNSTKTYTIGAVGGATGYTWSVPSGASISSGQGTTSVNVLYTNTYTSGNISVVATNSCGSSGASSITTTGVPAQPGNINGPASVCHNQNNVIYNIAAVTGATSYTWTVPPGTQIKNGQGTVQIKVRFGNSAGNITVKANNACGSGPIRTLAIAMPCREEESISLNDFEVNVYPNPSSNDFTFVIDASEKISCSINIFDLTGRIVESHQHISAGKEFKCGEELTNGIYYVEIISEKERKIVKLVKQK
ncbi:MAG TPA: LamG-like jellyroll fold domain-containing protein [Bacteroidia bacterium]|nr:LamG-like jellyroll fold domain-containing protein [Bacteroidia bacterium]